MIFSTHIPVCDGIASHVVGLAKRLRARGNNITLMTRGNYRGSLELEYEGFKVIKVPFYPIYPFHVYFHGFFVKKTLEKIAPQPDLIHLHTPLVPPLHKRWPLVTTFHTPMLVDTSYVENVGLRSFLIKLMGKTTSYWIEKKLLSISDCVITVSEGVANELRTYYGYSGELIPIFNVIEKEFYKPNLFFPHEKKLLYVGRLAYRKGLIEIVNSASYVARGCPNVKYVLVGSGPLEKKLKEMVNKKALASNFEFCGDIRNPSTILKYYHDAYAVLIPSYYEGLPMVLLEAMSCGKPVITTKASFSKGIIENGVNGLLVKPKSVEELTDATIKLLSSKYLCNKLGEGARKTITEEMDIDKNTDKVEEVYHYAVEKFNKKRIC